jgi:hypothetical protein
VAVRGWFSQDFFLDLERLPKERLGLHIIPRQIVDQRQVVEARGRIRVLVSQDFPSDLQRLPMERLGLRVIPNRVIEVSQVVEARGRIRVLASQDFPPDLERLPIEWLGLRVIRHRVVERSQVVEAIGRVRVLQPQEPSPHFCYVFGHGDGLSKISFSVQGSDLEIVVFRLLEFSPLLWAQSRAVFDIEHRQPGVRHAPVVVAVKLGDSFVRSRCRGRERDAGDHQDGHQHGMSRLQPCPAAYQASPSGRARHRPPPKSEEKHQRPAYQWARFDSKRFPAGGSE